MKKLLILIMLSCGLAYGQMGYVRDLTLGTNGVGSVTFNDVRGELEAIHVLGTTTGDVTVAYSPLGGLTSVNLATNTVASQKLFRPVATSTDVAGAAIADYKSYILAGEDVTFSIAGGYSNATWKCVLILK